MNRFDDHFRDLARDWVCDPRAAWWERAAAFAILTGTFRVIPSRDGTQPYLLRCWLTPVVVAEGGEVFESADSILLHHFLKPDDDEALHDHPWGFSTTILAGGYDEALPPIGWSPEQGGPSFDARLVRRSVGDRVDHLATDMHAVARIEPGTWTMVRTGPKERTWFFHPPGEQPVPWRDFLAGRRAPVRA